MSKRPIPPPSPRAVKLAEHLDKARELFKASVEYVYLLKQELLKDSGALDKQDCVDVGFLCRELEDHADAIRKEFKLCKDEVARRLGETLIREVTLNEVDDPRVDGHYATATADVDVTPIVPNRKSDEFKQALVFMGVPEELIDGEVIDVRWPKLSAYLKARLERGETLPPFMRSVQTPTVVFRRRTQAKA